MAFVYKSANNKSAALTEAANNATFGTGTYWMIVYQDTSDNTHGIVISASGATGTPTITEAAESEHLIDDLVAIANDKLSFKANTTEKVAVTKADLITVLGSSLPSSFAPTNAEANLAPLTQADIVSILDTALSNKLEVADLPTDNDTIYDDTDILEAIALNTAKVTNSHQDISGKADLVNGKVPADQLPAATGQVQSDYAQTDTAAADFIKNKPAAVAAILNTEEVAHVQFEVKEGARNLDNPLDVTFKHKKGKWQSIDPYLSIYTQDEDTYVKYHSPAGLGYPNSITLWFSIKGKKKSDSKFEYKNNIGNDVTMASGGQTRLAWFHVKAWDDKDINKGDLCEIRVSLVTHIDGFPRPVIKNYIINQKDVGGRMIESKVQTSGLSLVSDAVAATNGGVYN